MTPSVQSRVVIADTTLRDGEQTYGVVFSNFEKLQIARLLNSLRIGEIEVGFPANEGPEGAYIDELVALKSAGALQARLVGWHGPEADAIEWSSRRRLDGGCISFSPRHYRDIADSGRLVSPRFISEIVQYAKSLGLYVVASFQHALTIDSGLLLQMVRVSAEAGADRVRLCDTIGRADPFSVRSLVSTILRSCAIDVEVHAHNDLGMAVANSVAAARALADLASAGSISPDRLVYLSTAVNGLGERAGNASLEAVIAALELSLGLDLGLETAVLAALCDYVATASGRPIAINAPVVGRNIWRHCSGGHADAVVRDPTSSELIQPSYVGLSDVVRRVGISKHSNPRVVQDYYRTLGIELTLEAAGRLLSVIMERTVEVKRMLTDPELIELYRIGRS